MSEQLQGRRIPLRAKVAAAMVVAALVPTGIAGVLSYREASGALTDSVTGTLEAVRTSRADGLYRYSTGIERQVQDAGLHFEAKLALEGLDPAYQATDPESLREIYLGSLGDLTDGGDGSTWTAEHVEYHESFRDFQRSYGYYDLFLFNTAGDLVYSVFKEPDFATNFIDGPYAASGLGEAFRGALAGDVTWADYAAYEPSLGAPAAFVAAPLVDGATVVGVIALQMPIDEISSIMQNNVGLGETGETYLVGADGLMRSQSRFSEESTILATEVATETVAAAIAGETGTSTILDYRGVEVLSSFQPVSVFGQDYALIAEQDSAEALEATRALARQVAITSLLAAMAMGIGGVWFAKQIGDPIARVAEASTRLAVGDTNVALEATSNDEIGDMIGAFGETVSYLKALSQLAETVAAGDLTPEHSPAGNEDMLGHALTAMVESLRGLVGEVHQVASDIDGSSDGLSRSAGDSARAAEEVAQSIVTVAGAATDQANIAERLVEAVHQINDEVKAASDAARLMVEASLTARDNAGQGVELIEGATGAMKAITDAFTNVEASVAALEGKFTEVGEIVELIRSIAEQTNLLALNAAIEAARAGELGRGFAVVASEVKALAEESANSTEKIATIVSEMKSGVGAAVKAAGDGRDELEKSSGVVLGAGQAFKTIADSVDDIDRRAKEVSNATDRIDVVAGTVSKGADELTSLTESNSAVAEEVAAASEETAASAAEVGEHAARLAQSAIQLNTSLSRFMV